MVFKILSTAAVFLFGTVWAFRNLRFIFDKIAVITGIGMTSEERQAAKNSILKDDTSNTGSNNT